MLSQEMKVLDNAHMHTFSIIVLMIFPFQTVWNLYEQICVAALDIGDVNLATECIVLLMKKFPSSGRVIRLLGLQKEQAGEYEAALEIYVGLLKKNPANLMAMKRKVCVYKAMGDTKKQIEEINGILKQFPAEAPSWQELGELYLSLCDNEVQNILLGTPPSHPVCFVQFFWYCLCNIIFIAGTFNYCRLQHTASRS